MVLGGIVGEVEIEIGEGVVVYGVLVIWFDGICVEVYLDWDFWVLDIELVDGDGG